jgi:hypothetical protein
MWIKEFRGRLLNLDRCSYIFIQHNQHEKSFDVRANFVSDYKIIQEGFATREDAQKFIDDLFSHLLK